MKTTTKVLVIISILLVTACNAFKKGKKTAPTAPVSVTEPAVTVPTPSAVAVTPFLAPKSPDGIYPPEAGELNAILPQYKEVTLARLKEGYSIYTQGACVNCHNPRNICQFNEGSWKGIIDDMAQKAMLPPAQKDAVYKYVLAIKATQPK